MRKRIVLYMLNRSLDMTSYVLNFIVKHQWFKLADKLMKFRKQYIIKLLLLEFDELEQKIEKINGRHKAMP